MLDPSSSPRISLTQSAWQWWNDVAAREGRFAATRQLLAALWEFVRDSTPERRRQRFGDADYDWEHRVNTTSAAVGWRDRLLGVFYSPYQPTEAALFHEIIEALRERYQEPSVLHVDKRSWQLLPALHRAAQENLSKYRSESQKCFALESICGDATEFAFPAEPIMLYLFNPFPEAGLQRVIANLEESLREYPRALYVLYHNPLLEHVLSESTVLKKVGGTHQYAVYEARIGPDGNADRRSDPD